MRVGLCPHPTVLSRPQACIPSGLPARRFLYYLSYVKVAVAMAMYLPQVLLNHERRSTAGFSIEQVLGSLRFRAWG